MRSDQETLVDSESSFDFGHGFSDKNLRRERPVELWAAKRTTMTLNQFSSFAAVAKHLSLTKASRELHVSQSSITQQLKQLEDHHGTKLYRRLSKGIEITEAGQSLLRKIVPILEQVARLEGGGKLRQTVAAQARLRTGGTFNTCAVLLPELLARLQQRYPRASLNAEPEVQSNLSVS